VSDNVEKSFKTGDDDDDDVIEHKRRVFIFSTTFVRTISHTKMNSARYDQTVHWSSRTETVILGRF
jgi:hypothetical protein